MRYLSLLQIRQTATAHVNGVVQERPPRVLEVARSIPGRVVPKSLKMVVKAALLGVQDGGFSITTDWLAGVRINGPGVLATYPGNAVI